MFVQYFCIYLVSCYLAVYFELLNKEQFWLKLCLISLPFRPLLFVGCGSVLSTGTFTVMIVCALQVGLLGFAPVGREEGRAAYTYDYRCESTS